MRVALPERFDERDVNVVVEPWILDRHVVQIALRALLTNWLQALLDLAPQPLLDACHPFPDLGIGQHCGPSFRVQAVEILLDDLLILVLQRLETFLRLRLRFLTSSQLGGDLLQFLILLPKRLRELPDSLLCVTGELLIVSSRLLVVHRLAIWSWHLTLLRGILRLALSLVVGATSLSRLHRLLAVTRSLLLDSLPHVASLGREGPLRLSVGVDRHRPGLQWLTRSGIDH